tara:strand:+ start:87 stop:206 length:120 start_codon:yes stop_codon:yes gene_type:complete
MVEVDRVLLLPQDQEDLVEVEVEVLAQAVQDLEMETHLQ